MHENVKKCFRRRIKKRDRDGTFHRYISNFLSTYVSMNKMSPFKFKDGLAPAKEKIGNKFTAIKYSGLEDSNKFFPRMCTHFSQIYLWINKTISEEAKKEPTINI